MNRLGPLFFAAALLTGLVACDAKTDTAAPDKKSEAGSADSAKKDGATKPAAATPDPKPIEMVEHDLSSAHESWKGWVAEGPKDAKVLADGVNGARIAAKGPNIMERKPGGDNGFDVNWQAGKKDLKALKASLEKGAENSADDYKMTLDFTKSDDTMLEWTTDVKGNKSYNFVKHMQVDGKDYTCSNNYMMGSGNEAEHKRALAACDTLKKK